MNDLNFKALAFAYLLRGLDQYATDNEFPRVGDEEHPIYNDGEYEALNVIFEAFSGWLDRVTPVEIPLSAFFYNFIENMLSHEVYESNDVWFSVATRNLKNYTIMFNELPSDPFNNQPPLIHGQPGTGKTGVVNMNNQQYKTVSLVYLIRGIDAYAKQKGLPNIGTEEHQHSFFNEGENRAIARIEEWFSNWLNDAAFVEIDQVEFLYEFLEEPENLPSLVYYGIHSDRDEMDRSASKMLTDFVNRVSLNKSVNDSYRVSGESSEGSFSVVVSDTNIQRAIQQAVFHVAELEGIHCFTINVREAVKQE